MTTTKPMSWAEWCAQAHQRPLPLAVLDQVAELEAVVRSRSCRPATGPDDAADLEVPGAEDR